ncbi:MAG: hypothetical protein HUK07_01760 [Bacteroidaceae bacterium]|nr:hypothetical protein [Bacteroidaceae bacterium]
MKTFKATKILLATLMLSASSITMAQKPSEDNHKRPMMTPEQRKEMRWQAASKKLMLSDKQNEKVKVLFAEYTDELDALCPAKNKMRDNNNLQPRKPEAPKQLTEAEVKENMKQQFANQRKLVDIQEKYFDKFCKELNAHQAKYLIDFGKKDPKSKQDMMHGKGKNFDGQFGQRPNFGNGFQHNMPQMRRGMQAPKDSIR